MNKGIRGALLTLTIAVLGWSSIPLFLRHFSFSIDAWTSNGWRYAFSALLWSPALLYAYSKRTLAPRIWQKAIVPSVFNFIAQNFFTWAHYMVPPALLSFGLRANILFIALGAVLLFPEERRVVRSPWFILGMLLVIMGTSGTILLGTTPVEAVTLSGILLAIGSGLFFACYGLSVRHYMDGIPSLLAFSVISLYSASGMVALMFFLGEDAGLSVFSLSAFQFFLLMLSSFIGIALGHVCYYHAIAKLGVAVSSGVLQLQPFIVAVASMLVFGEVLTGRQWMSGGFAICGALMMILVQHRRSNSPAALIHTPPDPAHSL